jgi:glycosyltransferase involved in cell wall biosynthesis
MGMNPLVVLQVLPALDAGGVEAGTVEMAQAIVRAGGRAIVASAGGRMTQSVLRAGGRHVTLPLATKNPVRIWRNAARLEGVIRESGVTLVHARSRAPAWSAWLAARRTGVHFVTTWHGSYGETVPLKRRYNAVMARGERIIAISHHIAAEIVARHGVAEDRIRVIPRGVDPLRFDPDAVKGDRVAALAAQWRLPEDAAVILLAGRLTRWKGQTVAIEALARMRHRNACLVLAGSHQGRYAYARELETLAVRLGVGARVRLVGDCADMPAALRLANIALNASTTPEAFGRTVIEAQAMRALLIAANHGGAAETVTDGETGILVPPGDAAALAEALDRALALPEPTRRAIGEAARASVLAHHTTAAMQRATLRVYGEILGPEIIASGGAP